MKEYKAYGVFKLVPFMLTVILAVTLAAVLGKCAAEETHAHVREHMQDYALLNPPEADKTAELIGQAEAEARIDAALTEREYEQMDYEFFNGDAEAYPLPTK